MPTLRINQSRDTSGKHQLRLLLSGVPGQADLGAEASFAFELTDQEREQLRWYLEDYLQNPHDPAPAIARRIERRMAELGEQLFQAVFKSSEDGGDLWAGLRPQLHNTRIEISASVRDVEAIPWELLRDSKTDTAFALHAPAFIRARHGTARPVQLPNLPAPEGGKIRILLVICRPGGRADVPFRSVASRLVKGLTEQSRERYQLDVLRPPTFGRLAEVLRAAKADGKPYHVVHFDGHGAYFETPDKSRIAGWLKKLGMIMLSGPREGSHGYLLFENADAEEKAELVDGPTLGELLYEAQTPVLVLNACRSAHADPLEKPEDEGDAKEGSGSAAPPNAPATKDDPHHQVRAFGSLAQEVIDKGVAGVVAMRHNVYVVTAAQFVADLYGALAHGQSLGEAATYSRKQLAANPNRSIAYDPIPLQDWSVPVVFEAAPIQLFPKSKTGGGGLRIAVPGAGGPKDAARGEGLDPTLPPTPDAGFFGRDETLLALDRAFDRHTVVLLHAFAGSGKTAASAEFARWYHETGGLRDGGGGSGPVLFTSFEHHTPLRSVLGHFGRVFGPWLEKDAGVDWPALTETEQMRDVALQVMRQVPILWVWDNVEPVHGFPCGSKSDWSKEEQDELLDFLRTARGTKAKFLLTSRRPEDDWLGELPRRIEVPPMPMTERVQLARAIVEKRGGKFSAVKDWRPLLRFTQGNPMTITVLVRQALKENRTSKESIREFVEQLRAGEAQFEDEEEEGRSKSLGASLRYGFDAAFDEIERQRLALLHLFQGFVDVDALRWMGSLEKTTGEDYSLWVAKGLTREDWIGLLDRAADIGLLTAHGGGYYSIHPALPWFFKSLFDKYYPGDTDESLPDNPQSKALRAFVEAMGALGDHYFWQYEEGNRDVIAALEAEEANLLHARRLARALGWHDPVTSAMQGLRMLYYHTGRRRDWRRLVEEIVPDFIDPETDGPLPGREEKWSLVTEYRVLLAEETRDWAEAERLQSVCVEWDRRCAAPFLEKVVEKLDDKERNTIRTLAASLHELGQIQRERGEAECVKHYKESLELAERIGDQAGAAACAFNLGRAYQGDGVPALRDLDQAETWYHRSLELHAEGDRFGRAKCLGQLGLVAFVRFQEARAAKRPEGEILHWIVEAARLYHEALDLTPENAIADRAVVEGQLGSIYGDVGDLDRALTHHRESIRLEETQGNLFGAAMTRFNVALALANAGRFADALDYARAALRNFETFGPRATAEIEETQGLIARIEEAMRREKEKQGTEEAIG